MKPETLKAVAALEIHFDHNTNVKETREAMRAILNDYALNNLKGDEFTYFYNVTD